jgi:hypothetical protein
MDGLDLKKFLQDQVAEGKVDSQGAFTVAREKALTKLAYFGLPSDFDWVLKIVQAANIWRAPKLQVRQSRVATSFFLCPAKDQPFPSDTAIVQALNGLVLDKDNPVHQFAMALRSLVQQASLSFVLAVRQFGELGKPIFAGDDTSRLDSQTRAEWTEIDREGVRLTVSHFRADESYTGRYIPTFSRVIGRHIQIATMLERRCTASVVPIELDGRIVSTVYPTGSHQHDRRFRPLLTGHLMESPAQGRLATDTSESYRMDGLDVLSGKIPQRRLAVCASSKGESQPWFLVRVPEVRSIGSVYRMLDSSLGGVVDRTSYYHTFCWVRHGVTVAKFSFKAGTLADQLLSVYFPAAHLRTDLSGLQIEMEKGVPPAALAALETLKSEIAALLERGDLSDLLTSGPAQPLPKVAKTSQSRDELGQAGHSVLTESIALRLPSLTEGSLKALDSVSDLVSGTLFAERTISRWAKHVQETMRLLLDDLDCGKLMTRNELE